MGRRPRIHFPGATYHAIVRGNNREPIFRRPCDKLVFNDLVAAGCKKFDHRIYAFCWMFNHAHLMIEVGQTPLSKVLHNLSFRYSQWFNREYSRSGHLFERRFRSGLIETDGSAINLARYIHLNPVKAGMVQNPAKFRWSSHRAYLGLESIPWLETDRILSLFADVRVDAIKHYELFTKEESKLDEQSSPDYDPEQLHELCTWTDRDEENESDDQDYLSVPQLFQVVCENLDIQVSSVLGPSQKRDLTFARAVISLIGRESASVSNSEIARSMGRDPSATSHAADRLVKRMSRDETLRLRVDQIRQSTNRSGSN